MSTPPAQPQPIAVNNNHGVVVGVVNGLHVHAAPEKLTLYSEVTRYYQKLASACDVVTAQHHYPSVKTPSTQSKVEDVYVEPDVWVRSLETEGADGTAAEKRALPAFERQPWKSCFNSDEQRFQRIALLADGGMGKTTAVDREIQRLCDGQRPWLALRLPSLLRVDGGVPLSELVEQALTLDIVARLSLDRAAAEKIGHSLLNHLDCQAGVLLFDGFDEVPVDQRPDILNRVLLFLASAARKQPKHKVVLTSRPYAIDPADVQAELVRHGFEQLRLAPFSPEQQAELVTRYFSVAPREKMVGRALIEQLRYLNRKEGDARYTDEGAQGLAALMREPMLATYACMLAEERRLRSTLVPIFESPLPATRHELLDSVVEFLLEKWDVNRRDSEQTESFSSLFVPNPEVDQHRSRLRRLVEKAALQEHLHNAQYKTTRGSASEGQLVPDLPADWQLQQLYEAFYRGEVYSALTTDWLIARIDHALPPDLPVRARHVAQWLTQRSGLMRSELRHRTDEPRMQHRQLADFLTAGALGHDRNSDDHARALVEQAWFSPDWSRQMIALGFERLVVAARAGKVVNTSALCAGLAHWRAWSERLDPEDTELFTAVLAQALARAIPADWFDAQGRATDKTLDAALDPMRERLVNMISAQRLSAPERAATADALGALGDPRFTPGLWLPRERYNINTEVDEPVPGFVRVPAGSFWIGEAGMKDNPPREATIEHDFYIARCLTTVAQYRRFVDAGAYGGWLPEKDSAAWGETGLAWRQTAGPDKRPLLRPRGWAEQLVSPHRPVVYISWWEARAYACWLNDDPEWQRAQTAATALAGLRVGLPSELQWERAARLDTLGGAHCHRWPWGDEAEDFDRRANVEESGVGSVSPVGCFEPNPFGIWDLAGNAWEWMDNAVQDLAHAPQQLMAVDEPSLGKMYNPALRGGAWHASSPNDGRASVRDTNQPDNWGLDVGFRVVLSLARLTPDT